MVRHPIFAAALRPQRPGRTLPGWAVALALLGLVLAAPAARAEFMIDTNPGGEMMFIDVANKDVSSFHGFVGSNDPAKNPPIIDISATQNVDTGSGFSNITPVKGSTLSSLTFTPENPNLFGDFSFRGQLLAAGDVTVTVQDNQGGKPQTFTFSNLPKDADFDRIGIIAVPNSNETIQSVTIANVGFKEVKQIEFSLAGEQPPPNPGPTPVPEPASALLLILGAGVCGTYYRRGRNAAAPVAD